MKDLDKPITNDERAFVVGVSIGVGVVAGFFVFIGLFGATASSEYVAGPFIFSLLIALITMAVVPFAYLVIGRICAVQLDRTREETYKHTKEPWSKSEVVKLSTVSPITIAPMHLYYFGIQCFDEQWSEKNLRQPSPAETVVQNSES